MKKNNILEIIIFVFFCIAVIFLSFFHEPWFDEFQAWGISKDSIYNILFVIPHFEGHPPLWYLILKIFSSLNLNPELGVRIPNLLFMFGAVCLLIFKSPFPRIVRLSLPFTYFIFYQYSIISRPYSIFCFAIFLSAYLYKTRNEKPFRFVLSLMLLCLSSLYGMVIASAIVFTWFIGIIKERNFSVTEFIKDKRFKAMFLIFLLCLILTCELYPDKNVFALNYNISTDYRLRAFYSYFLLPADSLFYNFMNDITIPVVLTCNISDFFKVSLNPYIITSFWLGCCFGLVTNCLLFYIFKRLGKTLLFFIPYIVLLSICVIYISTHHIGLVTVLIISLFWCSLSDLSQQHEIKYKKLLYVLAACCILIQIYWSVSASYNDIKDDYSYGRKLYSLIKKYDMDKYKIMIKPIGMDNLNISYDAVLINQYFNKNIFCNFNVDEPDKLYAVHKHLSKVEMEKLKEKLRNKGLPDIIAGLIDIDSIFINEERPSKNYVFFDKIKMDKCWKNQTISGLRKIYIKNDLYDDFKNKQSKI